MDPELDSSSTMDVEDEPAVLRTRSDLRKSGEYSDVTVVCGKYVFPVHRVILSSKSEFFTKAFNSGFTESFSGKIELKDHPLVVHAMLEWIYIGTFDTYDDYEYPEGVCPGNSVESEDFLEVYRPVWLEMQVYLLADRLHIDGLKEQALDYLTSRLTDGMKSEESEPPNPDYCKILFYAIKIAYDPNSHQSLDLQKELTDIVFDTLKHLDGKVLRGLLEGFPDFMCHLMAKFLSEYGPGPENDGLALVNFGAWARGHKWCQIPL